MTVSINTRTKVETFGVASRKTVNQTSHRAFVASVVLSGSRVSVRDRALSPDPLATGIGITVNGSGVKYIGGKPRQWDT